MTEHSEQIEQYWRVYLATLPDDHPHHQAGYSAWSFGDSAEMAQELGQLVVDGVKRATASLLLEYDTDDNHRTPQHTDTEKRDPVPPVGDLSIVLDGEGLPMCIIETVEIRIAPLSSVDAKFAFDEGEGDKSRAYWLDAHERFFRRRCEQEGWLFSDDIQTVFERFCVIFALT